MWLVFAVTAGLLYTIQGLLTRYILKGNRDAWAFSFYFSLVGALTALPFFVLNFQVSHRVFPWALMLLVGALIVLQNFLSFKSSNYLEASVQGAVTKARLLWVLVIGVLFLGESLTALKLVGTLLTIAGGLVLYVKVKNLEFQRGLWLALSATVIYAVVIGLYKFLFADFSSAALTFFIFAIPAGLNLVIMPQALSRIKEMALTQGKAVLIACFFGGLANLAMNHALMIGEASKVLVIIEAFLIIVLFGEHIFLKERTDFLRKMVAVGLATVGAILIRLSN